MLRQAHHQHSSGSESESSDSDSDSDSEDEEEDYFASSAQPKQIKQTSPVSRSVAQHTSPSLQTATKRGILEEEEEEDSDKSHVSSSEEGDGDYYTSSEEEEDEEDPLLQFKFVENLMSIFSFTCLYTIFILFLYLISIYMFL